MKRITTLENVPLSRRQVVAALALAGLFPASAWAAPKDARNKLAELTGGAKLEKGRVHLRLPAFTERGPFTRITVSVDSPMSDTDYVKAIHIVAERNTVPEVASYYFGPHNGRAEITTRIRMRKSQTIIAAAEMNDGSVFIGKGRVKVSRASGGCG